MQQNLNWIEIKERFPEKGLFDAKPVLVSCGQDMFVADYITNNQESKGKFYLNLRFPKKIFEDITEFVDCWSDVELPNHESIHLNSKF